jgi:alanine transaminase
VLNSLRRRAEAITEALSGMDGITCVSAGSMYAYPKITIPPKAIDEAKVVFF